MKETTDKGQPADALPPEETLKNERRDLFAKLARAERLEAISRGATIAVYVLALGLVSVVILDRFGVTDVAASLGINSDVSDAALVISPIVALCVGTLYFGRHRLPANRLRAKGMNASLRELKEELERLRGLVERGDRAALREPATEEKSQAKA